jgi:cyclopropane-fatty-acyl-phospholipid synthase
MKFENLLQDKLDAIGIEVTVGGNKPWDPRILNEERCKKAIFTGELGVCEAFMDGAWDVREPDTFFYRIFAAEKNPPIGTLFKHFFSLRQQLKNGHKSVAFEVGKRHYDLDPELFKQVLDPTMAYTCAEWRFGADSLADAQLTKLKRICRKLQLEPKERLLDIGSGWGSLIGFAAECCGVSATGLTVAENQAEFANRRYAGHTAETLTCDYRDHQSVEPYDKIASVGMFEHVGRSSFRTYMECAHRLLKPDGLFLLHYISSPRGTIRLNPFLDTYIFPNSEVPGDADVAKAYTGLFRLETAENIGADNYDRTLMAWLSNLNASRATLRLSYPTFSERDYRMMHLYLASVAASFRAKQFQVTQLVLSPRKSSRQYRWLP